VRKTIHLLSWFGSPNLRKRGASLQQQLADSTFAAAAISSIAEFHEIQCYFIVSIQIATLLNFNAENPSAGGNQSGSFAEAIFNSETSIVLSIASIAPVIFTQFGLHRAGIHWWYTFATMSVTVVLAITIYARQDLVMVSPDGLWKTLVSERAVSSCGMNPAPIVYCGISDDPGFTTMDAYPVYIGSLIGLVGWVVLLVDQIACTIRTCSPSAAEKKRGILAWTAQLLERHKRSRAGRRLVALFATVAELILFGNVAMYAILLALTIRETDFISLSSWGFGQVIAVMVWTPTMAKYLYYIICKLPSIFYPFREGHSGIYGC
jgi:hypothetical protein